MKKLKKGMILTREELCEILDIPYVKSTDSVKAFDKHLSILCDWKKIGTTRNTRYHILRVYKTPKKLNDKRGRKTKYGKNSIDIFLFNAMSRHAEDIQNGVREFIYSKTQLLNEAEYLPKWYYTLCSTYTIYPEERKDEYKYNEMTIKGIELLNYSQPDKYNLMLLQNILDLVRRYFKPSQLINNLNKSDKIDIEPLDTPCYKSKSTRWRWIIMSDEQKELWERSIEEYPIANSNMNITHSNYKNAVKYWKLLICSELDEAFDCSKLYISTKPYRVIFNLNKKDIKGISDICRKYDIIKEMEDNEDINKDEIMTILIILEANKKEITDRMIEYINGNYKEVKNMEVTTTSEADKYYKVKYLHDNKGKILEIFNDIDNNEILLDHITFIDNMLHRELNNDTVIVDNEAYEQLLEYKNNASRYTPYKLEEDYKNVVETIEKYYNALAEELSNKPFEEIIDIIDNDDNLDDLSDWIF